MKTTIAAFISAVEQSKVLTGVQKKELLDKPELLPERYRDHIVSILSGYDTRAREREDRVKNYVADAQEKFSHAMDSEHIPVDVKQALLAKSRQLTHAVSQKVPTS
ncbi:MAG: hypothetical protein AAB542_03750 [Patescibacteria group bacterium]